MKTIKKIVITGGPCSGKSTMLNLIENTFKEKGYKVLIVSETATELIRGGISPLGGKENMFIFQDYLLNLQFKKEEVYEELTEEASKTMIREGQPCAIFERVIRLENMVYSWWD